MATLGERILIFNTISALFLPDILQKNGITITREQLLLFGKEIRDYKKRNSEWALLEVKSKDGDEVTLIL